MNKLAKIFKEHLCGRKTEHSQDLMNKIVIELKDKGYKPPYMFSKIAEINKGNKPNSNSRKVKKMNYIKRKKMIFTTKIPSFTHFLKNAQENGGYYYHSTPAANIPQIIMEGLKPSEDSHWGGDLGAFSEGKVMMANTPEQAYFYGEVLFRQHLTYNNQASIPILLRVPKGEMFQEDPSQGGDYYSEEIQNQKEIEFLWHGKWRPVSEASFIDEYMMVVMNEEGIYENWEGEEISSLVLDVAEDIKKWYFIGE